MLESVNTTTLSNLSDFGALFCDGDWIESKDQDPDGDVRLIQLADIGDGYFINKSNRYMTRKKAKELRCTFLKKGDVLIARMPDPLGRACIFPLSEENKYVTVVDIAIFRPNNTEIDSNFLMSIVNSPQIRQQISMLQSGTTRKRISRGNLGELSIPLPQLDEQRNAVNKINTLFSEIDKGTQEIESAKQKLDLYRQSILNASAFGEVTTLEEILDDDRGIFDGPFGSNLKSSDYTPSGVRVIRLENIGTLYFKDEATYISDKKYESLKKHTVFSGDIVFSSFVAEKVRACFIPEAIQFAVNKADCFCLRPNQNLINPEFLLYQICSPSFYQNLISEVKGVTRPRVNTKILRKMPLYLPDLKKQGEIIRVIKESLSATTKVENEIARSEQKIVQLKQAILKKAFEGNL
ncbi:restriction endonuclease subunit S [Bdellovibrio reynosensis]|uniref:Restriction endonuclease subunit S n=1 Tax=Bdellovibrio reynosensis TaxID=2835041 RepID=A0ABY4CH05_9BACT|nr:restriction endonuclease subunit S [Bdellovibrio reynosensis]UOF01495.1 restriction endonuclease subunit S [Bdellovibrio reynosensis]